MRKFCEKCNRIVETTVVTRHETYNVFGEPVETDTKVRICTYCGNDLFDEKLDDATLRRVRNEYRKRHQTEG